MPALAPAAVTQDTTVHALWHIVGANVWPFGTSEQAALVAAIGSLLPGTSIGQREAREHAHASLRI